MHQGGVDIFHAADSGRQSVSVQGCSGEILAVYPIEFDHMEVMIIIQ